MSYFLFVLWFIASILVGYSYFLYRTNLLAHELFLTVFLGISLGGFVLDRICPNPSWQKSVAILLKLILTLLALIALSGEYHRLFGESLPLAD